MRWINDLLCSFNIAAVVVWASAERIPSKLLNILGRLVYAFIIPVIKRISPTSNFQSNGFIAYFAMSLLLTLIVFIMLRGVAWIRSPKSLTLASYGILNIAPFPVALLYLGGGWRTSLMQPTLLAFEVAVVAVITILYAYKTPPFSSFLGTLCLTILHFTLWSWIRGDFGTPVNIAWSKGAFSLAAWGFLVKIFLLPVLGILSSAVWGLLVKSSPKVSHDQEVVLA